MAFQQEVGNVVTKEHGITQIGSNIQLNLGDSGGEREAIQRWFAPWLFMEWTEGRSQPKILNSFVAVPGCGSWLLDEVIPIWLASSKDSLWLTGEVGSGKSILCALVIQRLTRARRHDDSRQIVVPLIFSYNNDYTHNVTFLTYTILAYLCSAEPIPEAIVKARKAHVSPSEIADINDLIMNVLVSLGETNATGSTDSTTSVVLAIDALDEIPLESQITNMELLNRLTAAIKTGCGLRVRVALFTRHDDRLLPLCHSRLGWHRTVIPRSRVDEDIRTAVGVRLEKGTRLIKADREKLADRVVDKAAGMFRLASLYVDELVKSRRRSFMPSELEHLLNGLPTDLYPFYDRILDQIPRDRMQEVVFKALRWIMFAASSFWVEDLVEACAIYPPSGELFDVETRQHLPYLDVVEYLSGLVRIQPILSEDEEMVIEPRTHTITLAHFSVSEYLQRLDTAHYQIDTHFFERHSASEYMSQACLIYLVETSEHSLSSATHTTMIEYADRAWPLHVAAYLQSSENSPYARQATPAALASKIRNSVEFSNLRIYDDCDFLREVVGSIAHSCLDHHLYKVLFNALSRITKDQEDLNPGHNGAEPYAETSWEYRIRSYYPADPGYIRLLILHPAAHLGAQVRCSLIVDHLENRARYDYLSYVWGRSARDRLIQVNRQDVRAMSNLFDALLGLRSSEKPMLLWVDAICIDPDSDVEKNIQVAQMGDIVRYANTTQVWLPKKGCNDTHSTKCLQSLYSQAYWHRRWILQELILAQDVRVQWAQVSLTWTDLMRLVRRHTIDLNKSQPGQETLSAISFFSFVQELREAQQLHGPLSKLEELLYMFRNNFCTAPSDTLYSILPLLSTVETSGIEIDYRVSFYDTMTYLATTLLRRSQNYHVLSMISDGPREFWPMMPSWVPTWTDIEDHPLAPGDAITKQPKLYGASAAIRTYVVDGEILCVGGWLIGNIAHVAKIPDIMRNSRIVEFERESLVRVALEDRCRENPLCAFQRMTTQSRDWFTELPNASRLLSELESRGSRARRCFAKTDSKLVANVPAHTAVGDVIAIFHGGEVPYVLRPIDGCFTLIGECYVDGYMDGQATRKRTSDNPDVIFRIR